MVRISVHLVLAAVQIYQYNRKQIGTTIKNRLIYAYRTIISINCLNLPPEFLSPEFLQLSRNLIQANNMREAFA